MKTVTLELIYKTKLGCVSPRFKRIVRPGREAFRVLKINPLKMFHSFENFALGEKFRKVLESNNIETI